jgi:hypothetical protein
MVTNGTLLVKDRRGNIDSITIEKLQSEYDTYQALTMNRHGHETYSFSLIEKIKEVSTDDSHLFRIETTNHLDMKRAVICTADTQIYTQSQRWSGYVNPDKLRKNAIFIDNEDRVNRILSIDKIPYEGQRLYDISIMFTGNFFFNGILVR